MNAGQSIGTGRESRGRALREGVPDVLQAILRSTREQVRQRMLKEPQQRLEERVAERPHPWAREHRFRGALARPGLSVIAEFKRRSPSAGELRAGSSVREVVSAYQRGGASALSVLTETEHFDGSLEDLRAARAASDLPILRKDFIVDPYQLYEASAASADAILLIVAALEDRELARLHALAWELGLDVLVEVHDRAELARALALRPSIVGVNNRDLRDFSVDVRRSLDLLAEMPAGITVVSESGIAAPAQLNELERAGVDAVLIGESLMRAENPQAALSTLLAGLDQT
jgi:indole-3-glycerol phosphate synthase